MIRKPTLAEWFLNYQLTYIEKNQFHVPAFVDIDLTKIYDHYQDRRVPMTTLLVKACGLWQEQCPEINRQVFKTPFGERIYESNDFSVNLPVVLKESSEQYLSVTSIKAPHLKSIETIKSDIKKFAATKPSSLPVGKYLFQKKNNLLNRTRLKVIHFIVNAFPQIHEKHSVGTISVSSLLNIKIDNPSVTFMARGPGAITLTVCGVDEDNKIMKIGIGWDHRVCSGSEVVGASNELSNILEGRNSVIFERLLV
jgi:hypothetical protein